MRKIVKKITAMPTPLEENFLMGSSVVKFSTEPKSGIMNIIPGRKICLLQPRLPMYLKMCLSKPF